MAQPLWADQEQDNLVPGPPGPGGPQVFTHTAYYNEHPVPIEGLEVDAYYRAPTYQQLSQSLTAQQKELCDNLPKFSGNSEEVTMFIKRVDQAMQDLRMTSGQVASALFSNYSPLKGKAALFVNHCRSDLTDQSQYRHANFWCAQEAIPGRDWQPYQPRRESIDSINESIASVESRASVATQDSINTAASIGDPQVPENYTPHVVGVHGIENRRLDDRTKRVHHLPHEPAVHRRRHQFHRDPIPDQPAIPPLPHVVPNQCLRHYIFYEFHEKMDRQQIEKQFELAKCPKPRQSVREYIWALKIAHDKYKHAKFGNLSPAQKLHMKADDDYTLTTIIKTNAIKDFKTFLQQKLTTDPECLETMDQMEQMARRWETMTDIGKNLTNSCKSDEKVQPVMALTSLEQNGGLLSQNMAAMAQQQQSMSQQNYKPSYFSYDFNPQTGTAPNFQMQQPYVPYTYADQTPFMQGAAAATAFQQTPPMPSHLASKLTGEEWKSACTAVQQQQQQAAATADMIAKINAASTQPPPGRGRGTGNRGRGGRGGSRGRGRGTSQGQGQQQPGQQQPQPPPNILPPGCQEHWTPSAAQEAVCVHTNNGRPRCYYCGVCGHPFSGCGYRREDVKNGKTWTIHPRRGQLLPKATNSNRYKTYKKTQAASSLSVANFSDFVLTVTNDPNYQQQQQQQQGYQQPNQQQHQPQDVAAENAALRTELINLRARMTAAAQQQGHQDVAAVATAPPQAQRKISFRTSPQGGCLPKPPRPPCQTQQPQQPPKALTEAECYRIMDKMTTPDYNQMHHDLLERHDQEYLKLLQESKAKEATEELNMWV